MPDNDNSDTAFGKDIKLDCSSKHIKEAIENSLRRLKTDYTDLYYAHRIDPNVEVGEEMVEAMSELVREGKVRFLGLSECSVDELKRANKIHPISAVQSEYSVITRNVEQNGMLEATKELGITFVPFSPLSRGLMSNTLRGAKFAQNDFRSALPRYSGENFKNNLNLAKEFALIADKKGITPSQLAIAWVLNRGENIIPIPGTKKRAYLRENLLASDILLSSDEMDKIDELLKKFPNIGQRYASKENKFVK